MAASAYRERDEMPLDLQMDLLVDAELTEGERRDVILSLDQDPKRWRELSIRFLQRQVERESVKQLMGHGNLIPVDLTPPTIRTHVFPRWMTSPNTFAAAAGLLIAVISATITFYVVQGNRATPGKPIMVTLSGQAVGAPDALPVELPIVPSSSNAATDSFDAPVRPGMTRRMIIQPDGSGNALLIPVNTMPMQVN